MGVDVSGVPSYVFDIITQTFLIPERPSRKT